MKYKLYIANIFFLLVNSMNGIEIEYKGKEYILTENRIVPKNNNKKYILLNADEKEIYFSLMDNGIKCINKEDLRYIRTLKFLEESKIELFKDLNLEETNLYSYDSNTEILGEPSMIFISLEKCWYEISEYERKFGKIQKEKFERFLLKSIAEFQKD